MGGRARRLRGAGWAVMCVQDREMKQPWCLVASDGKVGTPTLLRYYAKRWEIETNFRDLKALRFGMGLGAMPIASPEHRTGCCC